MKKANLVFGALLLCAAGVSAQAPAHRTVSSAYRPVANDLQMMEAFIIPASNAIFDVGANAPKSDKEWTAVRNNALILAEAGNLLHLRQRAGDNGDWKKFSALLTDAGRAAVKAVDAKDADKLSGDVSDQLLNSCETCHAKYLKKTGSK